LGFGIREARRKFLTTRQAALWTLLLAVAVLWPGRVLSPLDGVPLSGRAEAVLLGVVLPALWWIHPGFLARRLVQGSVGVLLAVKIATSVGLPQHGLCARFSTEPPFGGIISTIQIEEPAGILRSWDIRADWRNAVPRCTAILDRAYRSRREFPAWFVNLLNAIRPRVGDLALDIEGYVTVDHDGTFVVRTGEDMVVAGEVGNARVGVADGADIVVPLARGSHAIRLHAGLTGERWQFVPLWDGRDAWASARLISSPPTGLDAMVSRPVAVATSAMVLLLVVSWSLSSMATLGFFRPALIWSVTSAGLLLGLGALGRLERFAALFILGAALVPVATREKNARTAFFLIGLPWLALFVGHAWRDIGNITMYSAGDDWYVYQSAAYRIFLNGYWIQGGSPTFYFQPLYRWVAGGLHILFGDSSVGETYWDAACLLAAALVCFAIVKQLSGFRWALVAAALTLVTFTMSPTWYLIGRGLSEITALGWMSLATVCLLRARLGRPTAALAAGAFAVLMFYTRLNHLLLAAFLPAWLLPVRVRSRWDEIRRRIKRVHVRPAVVYAGTCAAGVMLFALHTWWYAGRFSLLYGTSFAVQQTGLRLSTIGSPAVWAAIAEAVGAQLWIREPPAIDPRAALVVAGAVLSLLAVLQVAAVNRLPASLALVTLGTIAGSFVAHTHEYPGRMSVHLVPFAVGMSVCALSRLFPARRKVRSPGAAPCIAT
jgi:hypothetical protein